jgi:hypothetical protein
MKNTAESNCVGVQTHTSQVYEEVIEFFLVLESSRLSRVSTRSEVGVDVRDSRERVKVRLSSSRLQLDCEYERVCRLDQLGRLTSLGNQGQTS